MTPLTKRAAKDGLEALAVVAVWLLIFTWARCGFC